jgi:hypothetical protein
MRNAHLLVATVLASSFATPSFTFAQSSLPPPGSSRPLSRGDEVLEAVHRSGAVPRCWNAFIQRQPDAPSVRFRVRIEVDETGRVSTATVLDPTPTLFAQCVHNEVRRATVPAGPAISVTTTYSFAAGTPAPVPTR